MALSRPAPLDAVLDAIDRAPLVRALTAEQRAELEQDLADIAAGRAAMVSHADVPRALEEMSLRQ